MHDPELARQFNYYADQWEEHCGKIGYHSMTAPYLDHPSCAYIVALGRPVVPLIMERYRFPKAPWQYVLQEIVGLKMLDDTVGYDPAEVRARWLAWWKNHAVHDDSYR